MPHALEPLEPQGPKGSEMVQFKRALHPAPPARFMFFHRRNGATAQQLTNVQVQQCLRFTWLLGMEGNRKMQPEVLG